MKVNTLISIVFGFLLSFTFGNTNYLEPVGNNVFRVIDTEDMIEFRCTFGGEPLAIWGSKINEEVDSSKPLSTVYVKEGFIASDVVPTNNIKTTIKGADGFHIADQNTPNGHISYSLSRDEPFYVATVNLPPKLSHNSEKIVSNHDIYVDQNRFVGRTPNKEFSFVASIGYFIYQNSNKVDVNVIAWDQNTKWSDYFSQNYQDIFYKTHPVKLEENYYAGYGFWVCGFPNPRAITEEQLKTFSDLKSKEVYFNKENNSTVVGRNKINFTDDVNFSKNLK